MPEPGQETLSRQLTALIEDVLRQWDGPMPRLAYITDGGNHQTQYFRRVLKRMRHPRCPGQRLKWKWVIDYYHACEYVYKLSEVLFSDATHPRLGAEDVSLAEKEAEGGFPSLAFGGSNPAAADRGGRRAEAIPQSLRLLPKTDSLPGLCEYRRNHLPIGSGVTEAACKTVFTQRLKQSGMTWKREGGQWIIDFRVVHFNDIWSHVYRHTCKRRFFLRWGLRRVRGTKLPEKPRNPWHWRDHTR